MSDIHPANESWATRNQWRCDAAHVVEKLRVAKDVHQLAILQKQIEKAMDELSKVSA